MLRMKAPEENVLGSTKERESLKALKEALIESLKRERDSIDSF